MSKLCLAAATAASAVVIDDFGTPGLPEYTRTVILDANGGASNVAAFSDANGFLEYNTTTYDGIEQAALIRNGLTLGVGEELQADFAVTGSQDLGLYVGGTTPTTGVRNDYVAVYARGTDTRLFSRGFDGTSELPLSTTAADVPYDSLFIARTDVNTYELGYYDGDVRNIIVTRMPTTANDGDVVGFYTDVRLGGTLASADNLSIVPIPEPASMALLGLGGLAALRRRR